MIRLSLSTTVVSRGRRSARPGGGIGGLIGGAGQGADSAMMRPSAETLVVRCGERRSGRSAAAGFRADVGDSLGCTLACAKSSLRHVSLARGLLARLLEKLSLSTSARRLAAVMTASAGVTAGVEMY